MPVFALIGCGVGCQGNSFSGNIYVPEQEGDAREIWKFNLSISALPVYRHVLDGRTWNNSLLILTK